MKLIKKTHKEKGFVLEQAGNTVIRLFKSMLVLTFFQILPFPFNLVVFFPSVVKNRFAIFLIKKA